MLNSKILYSSITVTILGITAQIIGFFIPILISEIFGANTITDAYYFAVSIPVLLVGIIVGGSMKVVFIPIFVEKLKKSDKEESENFLGSFTFVMILLSVACVFLLLFLIEIGLFDYLKGELGSYVKEYSYILIPLVPINIFINYYSSIYNAHQKFALIEIGNIVKYTILYFSISQFHTQYGMESALIGQLGGNLVALIITIVIIHRQLDIKWSNIKLNIHPEIRNVFVLSTVSILAFSFAQLNPFVAKLISSLLAEGSISILNYTEKLVQLPVAIIGTGFTTILTSYWAMMNSDNREAELSESYNKVISIIIMLVVPTSVGLLLLGSNLINLIYGGRSLSDLDLLTIAKCFSVLVFQIIPVYLHNTSMRIIHVKKDMKFIFYASIFALLANTLFMYVLSVTLSLSIFGLCLGFLISRSIISIVTLMYVGKKYVLINRKKFLRDILAIVTSTFVMFVICRIAQETFLTVQPIVNLLATIGIGSIVYFLMLRIIGHSELITLVKKLNPKTIFK